MSFCYALWGRRRGTLPAAGLIFGMFVACGTPIESKTIRCSWGLICPEGMLCNAATDTCFDPVQQMTVCDEKEDGAPCSLPSFPEGSLSCRSGICALRTCGDGVPDLGYEECDQGTDNSDTRPDACRLDCRRPRCGDGVVDSGEACDDGALNSDIIPSACRTDCSPPSCGNGVVEELEECDDGPDNSDSTPDACRTNCTTPRCGDGTIDSGEICDDGNVDSGDGCAGDCLSDEECGNGIIDTAVGEECDDGPDNSDSAPDACRTNCTKPRCGDGAIDSGEICDDGNIDSGDGCAGDCLSDEECGNGIIDTAVGEECDCGTSCPSSPGYVFCSETCRLIEACADGIDNDLDGLIDCDDSDCLGKGLIWCLDLPICQPAQPISCDYDFWHTTAGRLDIVQDYNCGATGLIGGERYYTFSHSESQPVEVTATFNSVNPNQRVFLLPVDSQSGICDLSASCQIAYPGSELIWSAEPNQLFYLAVDSLDASGADFTLSFGCRFLM